MKKKIFPIISILAIFLFILIGQMTLSGSMSSANNKTLSEEKTKTYEFIFKDLELKMTKGSVFKLDKLDQDIIILNFWASWCRPCVSEFKTLNQLIEKFPKEKLIVIGIDNDDEEAEKAVKKIEKQYKLKFESVIDEEADIASKFRINNIPSSIVFHKGKVIHFVNKEFDFIDKKFLELLKSKLE